jgi:hypothetical protein
MLTANEMSLNVLVQYEKLNSDNAPGIQDSQMSIILTQAQLFYIQSRLDKRTNVKREVFEETEMRSQGLSALIKDSNLSSVAQTVTNFNMYNGQFFTLPVDFMYAIYEYTEIDQLDCSEYPTSYYQGIYDPSEVYSRNEIVLYNGFFYQSPTNNNNTTPSIDTWTLITGATCPVYVISHDEFSRNQTNPFKQPYFDGVDGLVWRLVYSRTDSGYDDITTVTVDGVEYIASQTPKIHELVTNEDFSVLRYKLRYLRFPRKIIVDNTTPANQRHCELDAATHQAIVDIAVKLLKKSLSEPAVENIPGGDNIE